MRSSKVFCGEKYGIKYRLVEPRDAEFIVKIRTNEKLSRFINVTKNSISKQIKWIEAYKYREQAGIEYYYIFEDNCGTSLGVSRIHDINNENFNHGSWVFSPSAPLGASILGDIITREVGFEIFSLNNEFFDVRKANSSVLRYHKGYNPCIINEDEINVYFQLTNENFEIGKHRYLKMLKKVLML